MRLSNFDLELTPQTYGLKSIRLQNLGPLVAIVGPNGAGKTRLLKAVRDSVSADLAALRGQGSLSEQIDQLSNAESIWKGRVDAAAEKLKKVKGPDEIVVEAEHQNALQHLNGFQVQLNRARATKQRLARLYAVSPSVGTAAILVSTPQLLYGDASQLIIDQMFYPVDQIVSSVRFSQIGGNRQQLVGSFFRQLAFAVHEIENPHSDRAFLSEKVSLFNQARQFIQQMMGATLGCVRVNGQPLPALDGRVLDANELSEGQRLILGAVAGVLEGVAKVPGTALRGSVVLLDEPELHLHPRAVSKFVDVVKDMVGSDGQVWVATHSVPLLAHLELDQIWTMESGCVSPPGVNQHARALALLVGADAEVERLQEFSGQPAVFAAAKFAAECLVAPAVVGYKGDDPQIEVFMRALKELAQPGRKLTVLDYGAGRGRMAQGILETYGEVATEHIRYVAIEPDEGRHGEIRRAAGPLLGGDDLFTSVRAMPSRFDREVDVAVICNVLHEVQPTLWCDEMTQLLARLTAGGRVIVCEDQAMPHGERAHDLGFLILGAKEIGVLFGVAKPTQHLCPNEKYSERLVCVEMRGEQAQVTSESVRRAIVDLGRRVDGEIEMLSKRKVPGPADGRRYGLLCQLAVNATRSLKHIGGG